MTKKKYHQTGSEDLEKDFEKEINEAEIEEADGEEADLAEDQFQPFQRIGLCLSGGGYRAASFQLGTLSYLNEKKLGETTLLQNVKAISTVSGGTITGVLYALYVQKGKTFNEVYKKLTSWLNKKDLIKESLLKLNQNGSWNYSYKRKNVVNAFAEIYDESLVENATMKVFDDMNKSHLEFVCFNATEFNRGLRYRIQRGLGTHYFGCHGLQLGKSIYENFRLGDIIAASSAFTGGFEPISMPEDFLDPDSDTYDEITKKAGYKEAVGLMDGGIFDNQGIIGIEQYEKSKSVDPFDLILISDVSSPYLKDFDFAEEKPGGLREKTINEIENKVSNIKWIFWLSMILLAYTGYRLSDIADFQSSTSYGIGITLITFSIIFSGIFLFLKRKINDHYESLKQYINKLIPEYFRDRLKSFDYKNTKIKRIEQLLLDRVNSLKLLVPDVFLKVIRRLNYARLYENNKYENRRVSCLVRQLTKDDFNFKKRMGLDAWDFMSKHFEDDFNDKTFEGIVGAEIAKYTEVAADFDTTLWFTGSDKLDQRLKCLIISGQISCCQSLLVYLTKLINDQIFKSFDKITQKKLRKLQDDVIKDWRAFKVKPETLYDDLLIMSTTKMKPLVY